MLPGVLAGEYSWEEAHIDLLKLARFAGARLLVAEVDGVEPYLQEVSLKNRPSLHYDVLSINSGAAPSVELSLPPYSIAVKPIGRFLPAIEQLLARRNENNALRLAVVGGGVASAEVMIALNERYGSQLELALFTKAESVLDSFGKRTRSKASQLLDSFATVTCGVEIDDFEVKEAAQEVILLNQEQIKATVDGVLWITNVDAPNWLSSLRSPLCDRGFLKVNGYLASLQHQNIYAAGDVVDLTGQPRPKSGVFAVREGPILAYNLRAHLRAEPLRTFRAQKKALVLLRTSEKTALGDRGGYLGNNRALGRYKRFLDQSFMAKFQDLPEMEVEVDQVAESMQAELPDPMRCGGCGAKVGADILGNVLSKLNDESDSPERIELDDVAVFDLTTSRVAASCDGFRAMIDDPWRFGRIAAHHAMSDLYASGIQPKAALAIATVPAMSHPLMESDLFQMMAGAQDVLANAGTRLMGGHSAEGSELGVGFTVFGAMADALWTKGNLREGELLVATKALGTGVLLAGAMQGAVAVEDWSETLAKMDVDLAPLFAVLQKFKISSCTDVTGFGLLGHLAEMNRASGTSATIYLDNVQALNGAVKALEDGLQSSLQMNNEQALTDWEIDATLDQQKVRLLVDPQTCGGLLFGISAENANECVDEIREIGFTGADIIGVVTSVQQPSRIVANPSRLAACV